MFARFRVSRLALALAALALSACANLPRVPYTEAQSRAALPDGIANVRLWGDLSADAYQPIVQALARASATSGATDWLALSGGADDGAYGAGFLAGWTRSGTRPRFAVVSGVSTGALIAPLAFLGPDYDERIRTFYTDTKSADIFVIKGILPAFIGESIADITPLRGTVDRTIDAEMLARIAEEHRKGRRLYVVTTDLDAQRPVIWDMGAIASSGSPRALELFRNVLIASASVPGAFPPQLIDAQANGQSFEEMHVDGGATMQLLVVPKSLALSGSFAAWRRSAAPTIHIIVNNKLDPDFDVVRRRTLTIAGRSFSTLIKSSAYGSVGDAYAFAKRNRFGYKLTSIDRDFTAKSNELFDPVYMQALYDYGYQRGLSGAWRSTFEDQPAIRNGKISVARASTN